MSLWEYLGAWSSVTKWLWHLNWNSNDSSGNGNNWTDTSISYVDGKLWQCASFNGTTSKIDVWNIPLNVSDITIAFIIDWSTTWNRAVLFKDWYPSAWSRCIDLTCINSWWQWLYVSFFTTDSLCSCAYPTTLLPSWKVFCVITRDSSGIVEFYYNWVKQPKTQTSTNSWTLQNSSANVTLWYNSASIGYPNLNTTLDEVIIEGRVWTEAEAKKYYTYAKWQFWIL